MTPSMDVLRRKSASERLILVLLSICLAVRPAAELTPSHADRSNTAKRHRRILATTAQVGMINAALKAKGSTAEITEGLQSSAESASDAVVKGMISIYGQQKMSISISIMICKEKESARELIGAFGVRVAVQIVEEAVRGKGSPSTNAAARTIEQRKPRDNEMQ